MLVAGVWGNKCSQISQTRKTEDMKLEIPVHVAKRWLMHSVHSSEFAKWMEDTGLQVVEVPSPDKKGRRMLCQRNRRPPRSWLQKLILNTWWTKVRSPRLCSASARWSMDFRRMKSAAFNYVSKQSTWSIWEQRICISRSTAVLEALGKGASNC